MAAALCVAAIAVPTEAAPATQATVTAPVPGLEFTLKLPRDKTSFMVGETIPVTLSFANTGAESIYLSTYHLPPPCDAVFATFEVSPKDGAVDLWPGGADKGGFGYSGPAWPTPLLTRVPTEVTLAVNEFWRFERPGTYTVKATTNRLLIPAKGDAPVSEGGFIGGNRTASSTPITLRISPPNPAWQHEQVEAWRFFLANTRRLEGEGMQSAPANDLRFLNTREAAQLMIERLGNEQHPGSSMGEERFWRQGLVLFPDRDWLLGAMREAARKPDYPITPGFLDILVDLRLSPARKVPAQETDRADAEAATLFQERGVDAATALQAERVGAWLEADQSLDLKTGRARAMTLYSLVSGASDITNKQNPLIRERASRLAALLPPVFGDLPPDAQESLLMDYQWPLVHSAGMAAALLKKWNELTANRRDTSNRFGFDFPTQVMSRLVEVAPQEGRALILSEMQQPQPLVLFRALSLLPDKTLPALEPTFLGLLQSPLAANQLLGAQLIERYATAAIAPQVRIFAEQRQGKEPPFPGAKDEVVETLRRFLERAK